jgi:NAD(P)-dependent dehydrogenase (short-subunit alcohol dehydrogenase family)
MDFSGKAAFVTGASSGLGETIALSLAACPVRALVITGRDSSRLSAVESKCHATCASVFAIAADMNDPAAIDHVVAFIEAKTSAKLDIFIGNHGCTVESAPPPETDLGAFSEVMTVDFMSMVRLTNQLSRFMLEGGSIVFVSSLSSSVPSRGVSAYCCAKAALTMFAK